MRLALQLLGKPSITVAGITATVGARKNLQLLALLDLAPDLKLDRDAICERLWSDEPADRRREHLRPVASRLRAALADLGYPDLLQTDGPFLLLTERIPTDLDEILKGDPRLEIQHFQIVMAGWNVAVAADIRNVVQFILARSIEQHLQGNRSTPKAFDLINNFLATYPHSVRIVALYYKLLSEAREFEAATSLVQRFETTWLDDQGPTGMPDIEAEAAGISLEPPEADAKRVMEHLRKHLVPALAIVVGIAIGAFLIADLVAAPPHPVPFVRAHPWIFSGWARPTDSGYYDGYVFCPDGVTWNEASAFATALGCHLAKIRSENQNMKIFYGMGDEFVRDDTIPGWIGAKRSKGIWRWEDGSLIKPMKWEQGVEPTLLTEVACAGYQIVRKTTEAPWAAVPCETLADGFYLEADIDRHPDDNKTAWMMQHWKYSVGKP